MAQPNGQAPGRAARDQLSNVDRAAVVATAPWRRSPPLPLIESIGFFQFRAGPLTVQPALRAQRAMYHSGFASVPVPALVAHNLLANTPRTGMRFPISNLQMRHRVTPITDVLTIIG
jgi:hypothetical protein